MAYEQRDGQGSLFKNDEKKEAKHPDYRGSCKLNGVEYWISAWIKEGAKGKWMSLALQPKEDKQGRRQGGQQEEKRGTKDDDLIPF
jgi:hypothetical protein